MNVKRTVEEMWLCFYLFLFPEFNVCEEPAYHSLVFDFHYHLGSLRYGGWHIKIAQSHLYASVQDS